MRKIAVIIGSESDLKQCLTGLKFLQDLTLAPKNSPETKGGLVEIAGVYIRSQHRNTLETQKLIEKMLTDRVDVIITGAGWANHLSGCTDAYLRYTLKTENIKVIGVAFEDINEPRHTQAALLSISEVPGTQVIFKDGDGEFIGSAGFLRACRFAALVRLPTITLPAPKPARDLSLLEAISISESKQ